MKRRFAMHSTTMGAASLLDSIDIARSAEFDAFEIGDVKLAQHVAAGGTIDDVRDALVQAGIEALSFNSSEPLALPRGTDDVPALARSHDALCERVAALGCGLLVVRPPRELEHSTPKVWRDTASRTLASVGRAANAHGIRAALEFIGTGASTVRTLAAACEVAGSAAPPIGLVLDAFQFYAGASTWDMLDGVSADTVCLVRLNDSNKKPLEDLTDADRALPGDGVVPMRELLRQVESAGYRGAYSIQLSRPDYSEWEPRRLARVAHESLEAVCAEKDEQEGLLDYE
jgi:2-keto-myo-inositol isomerase